MSSFDPRLRVFQKIASDGQSYTPAGGKGQKLPKSAKWAATEKIHGANLQLYCKPDGSIVVAKRTGFLEPGESFFGSAEVVERLRPCVAQLLQAVGPCDHAILCGELFGGWYPAAEEWKGPFASGRVDKKTFAVSAAPGQPRPVQEGVYYSPRREFALFDVAIVDAAGREQYLPFARVLDMGAAAGFFTPPVISTGQWKDVEACRVEFDSLVPGALRSRYPGELPPAAVPQLPGGTNLAEGVVLKPLEACNNAVAYKGTAARPLYKRKHPMFSEVERIDGGAEAAAAASSPEDVLLLQVSAFVTPTRVNGAVSKLGDNATVDAVAEFAAEDAWADFWSTASQKAQAAYATLEPQAVAAVEQAVLKCAQQHAAAASTGPLA